MENLEGYSEAGTQPANHYPPAPQYIPTWEMLRDLWMGRMVYANTPEKIEYELGFEFFAAQHLVRAAPRPIKHTTQATSAEPLEGNRS